MPWRERVPNRPPVLVKIAPDIGDEALAALVETCVAEGVQGLIVSNTTISRPPGLRSPLAREAGGLSGAPLFRLSTAVLARAFLLARGRLVLIGVGGVSTGEHALTKIRAGASLVQLYTALRLCRSGADPTAEARTRRRAARRRLRARAGCGGQRRATSGRMRLMEHLPGFAPLAERYRRLHPRSVGRHP